MLNTLFNPERKMRKLRLYRVSLPDLKQLIQLGSQNFSSETVYKEKGGEPRACSPPSLILSSIPSPVYRSFSSLLSQTRPVSSVTRPYDIPESLPGISCPPQLDPNIGPPKPQCFCSHDAFPHTFRMAIHSPGPHALLTSPQN